MANITLAVPDELHKKMKKHPEIRWSEVARKAIDEKTRDLDKLEEMKTHKNPPEIIETLKKHKEDLRQRYGVKEIKLFGSHARGQASEESDVDLLIEFSRPIGWEITELKEHLEGLLQRKVDITTEKALKTPIKQRIIREATAI